MTNTFSPAHDYFLSDEVAARVAPRLRYPSPPAGLRWLRLQLRVLSAVAPELAFRQAWKLFCTPRRLPLKAWEAPALAEARRRTVPYETGPVAVYEWGPAAAPAVVLVHGWEHRASFWRAWVQPLVAAGYRVVALDGPAHGASGGQQTTLMGFSGAVQAVVNTVGEVRAIVAHSFGAASVAGLPVRLPAGVPLPRLVLLSAPVGPREVAERFADFLHLPNDFVERFAAYVQQATGRPASSFGAAVAGPGTGAEKVLVLHDEDDEIIPFAEGRQIAAAWPGAELRATRGLGHNRIMRDAGVVQAALAFIA
ncbi:alpha/beta fold hydrolase [Hymenobacter sp. BT770]|uniref:alpha/beta fold hydrolase n=1 Tax=Hymenobacter sp. BT770 TaxID=2886942 RepID=UPI001D0FA4B5|nr:alpha/beta fold hydrolase [Hymenobacter sp. BT770]MCC3152015.1 alpha/beta fold hydrolase [Hymenobacter sp. BT770]MDO3415302.1 alpha/beta fold hydrolase [Hymenobacter sp. BT770]